jgi:6-phospho-beta-glucosidase
MWINEYLFYFYYAERAVESITADGKTRGEEIVELNRRLLEQLHASDLEHEPAVGLRIFHAYLNRRHATYMHYAQPDGPSMSTADQAQAEQLKAAEAPPASDGEGYAGVALGIVEAMETGVPLYTALNVPNEGAIEGMEAGDVVEVSCVVDRQGVRTVPIGAMPSSQAELVHNVKLYERLTVQAIEQRSRAKAVAALMAHPLVLSYSRAKPLVEEYLAAHRQWVGEWGT